MHAINDIFPPKEQTDDDPISLKKLLQQEGSWVLFKEILGFCFHGGDKTIWVAEGKWDAMIQTLKGWLRTTSKNANYGVPFPEF